MQNVATRTPRLAPYVVVRHADAFVGFLTATLGGRLTYRTTRPDGSVSHAEVRIADAVLMLCDPGAEGALSPATLHLYVDDADATHARALAAGCVETMPPRDQPHGDRMGGARDPWGNHWWFSTPRAG